MYIIYVYCVYIGMWNKENFQWLEARGPTSELSLVESHTGCTIDNS